MGKNPQLSASKQASGGDFDRLETLLKNLPGILNSVRIKYCVPGIRSEYKYNHN
jgi:hypothetical protein